MLRMLVLYTALAAGANMVAAGEVDLDAANAAGLKLAAGNGQAVSQTIFTDPEGGEHTLADYAGQAVLLNFWATWCAPCREEMPYFSQLNSKYAGNGVQFVGIALDSADNVSLYSKSNPMSYPLLIAENEGSELTRKLGNSRLALPYTLVLGRNAEPLLIRTGHLPEQELDTLLQKASGG